MRRRLPVLMALALAGCGSTADRHAAVPSATPRSFTVEQSAAAAPTPKPAGRYLVATVVRRLRLYERPGGHVVTTLNRKTEFGSQTVLGVLGRRGPWLKVVVAALPNHHPGWVRARNTTLQATDVNIRVDRSAHRATLRDGHRRVLSFPVAVGRPGNETPLGRYAVTDKLEPTDGTSPYGCCALALTGHQTKLEPGWPGGDRLAIHGTPATWSIGKAVSLGCMRAPASALRKLMRRVPLGAPVVVHA